MRKNVTLGESAPAPASQSFNRIGSAANSNRMRPNFGNRCATAASGKSQATLINIATSSVPADPILRLRC